MLKIYVCEDNEIQRETISTIIKNYLSMNDFDALFFLSTNDPEEVLTNIDHARGDTGLYFLDVDLNASMNGIELGAQIRKKDPGAKIVFITAHIELTYLTFCYKVEPLDYFSKDNREDFQRRIIECIDISMERYYSSHSFEKDIFIKSGNSRIKVNLYDIEFVESSHVPHRLTMHLDNRRLDFYGSLKDVEKINDHFFRCHQSYVVNLLNIREVMPGEKKVIFKNGESCSVSSRCLKKLLHKMECGVKTGR